MYFNIMGDDIVSTSREKLEKFIRELHRLTTYVKASGDRLNIFHIINKAFEERCIQIFDPSNALYISKSDGYFNIDVCPQRDSIINLNTFLYLGRYKYSNGQMEKINAIRARQKELYNL